MATNHAPSWLNEAAEELNRRENRDDGAQVASSLSGSLTQLRDAIYLRVRRDVEIRAGRDSMHIPASEFESQLAAGNQIDVFQIAESTAAVTQFNYVSNSDQWYCDWLVRLRFHRTPDQPLVDQTSRYLAQSPENRRLTFCQALERVVPESTRAPLVLFRLIPMAVQLATAAAFGDSATAANLRRDQADVLPSILDCRRCQGRVLECDEACNPCGNPLWKYEWLTAVD